MKKYITIATLVAAGAVCANAEIENLNWTLQGWNGALENTALSNVLSSVEGWTASASYSTNSSSGIQTGGGFQVGAFRPNTNIGNGGSWVLNLSFVNNSGVDYTFDAIDLGVFTYNSEGDAQSSTAPRAATISVSGDVTASISGVVDAENKVGEPLEGGVIAYGNPVTWNLDTAPYTIASGETFTIELNLKKSTDFGDETQKGCFWGLNSISLVAVPEPSAFGLLAGLGALALVGARRRRR